MRLTLFFLITCQFIFWNVKALFVLQEIIQHMQVLVINLTRFNAVIFHDFTLVGGLNEFGSLEAFRDFASSSFNSFYFFWFKKMRRYPLQILISMRFYHGLRILAAYLLCYLLRFNLIHTFQ